MPLRIAGNASLVTGRPMHMSQSKLLVLVSPLIISLNNH